MYKKECRCRNPKAMCIWNRAWVQKRAYVGVRESFSVMMETSVKTTHYVYTFYVLSPCKVFLRRSTTLVFSTLFRAGGGSAQTVSVSSLQSHWLQVLVGNRQHKDSSVFLWDFFAYGYQQAGPTTPYKATAVVWMPLCYVFCFYHFVFRCAFIRFVIFWRGILVLSFFWSLFKAP